MADDNIISNLYDKYAKLSYIDNKNFSGSLSPIIIDEAFIPCDNINKFYSDTLFYLHLYNSLYLALYKQTDTDKHDISKFKTIVDNLKITMDTTDYTANTNIGVLNTNTFTFKCKGLLLGYSTNYNNYSYTQDKGRTDFFQFLYFRIPTTDKRAITDYRYSSINFDTRHEFDIPEGVYRTYFYSSDLIDIIENNKRLVYMDSRSIMEYYPYIWHIEHTMEYVQIQSSYRIFTLDANNNYVQFKQNGNIPMKKDVDYFIQSLRVIPYTLELNRDYYRNLLPDTNTHYNSYITVPKYTNFLPILSNIQQLETADITYPSLSTTANISNLTYKDEASSNSFINTYDEATRTNKLQKVLHEILNTTPENMMGYLLYHKINYNIIAYNTSIQMVIRNNYLNNSISTILNNSDYFTTTGSANKTELINAFNNMKDKRN